MKEDFEKGTKICSRCKKELPLDMFYKDKRESDLLRCCCKKCTSEQNKIYDSQNRNTFGRVEHKRGHSGVLKRDYELSEQQLQKRKMKRKISGVTTKQKNVWYTSMV